MNITPEEAAQALREIEQSRLAMRNAVRAHRGHLYLWLWGAIWAVMAVLNWSSPERYPWATLWLNVAGAVASFAIGFLQSRQIRSPIGQALRRGLRHDPRLRVLRLPGAPRRVPHLPGGLRMRHADLDAALHRRRPLVRPLLALDRNCGNGAHPRRFPVPAGFLLGLRAARRVHAPGERLLCPATSGGNRRGIPSIPPSISPPGCRSCPR